MKRINILDKHIAELIAAGEVVERPLSVVKELAENSIDAGATRISVEIKRGGTSFIKVSDNGCGISGADVRSAFLRHATSKIKSEGDLESISTLGFRGEALASICAVSRAELITCAENEEIGTRYLISGGKEELLEDAGRAKGTTFIIRDLFFNTPARMKFLKKDVAEANSISGIIDRLAISHPEVAVKFIRDGKETLNTLGDNKLSSCIYTVYGKEFFGDMIPVKYNLNGVNVEGLVSKPFAARPNRSMQHFFINGRYVKTRTGCASLEEAFKNSVMVGKYPYCVLYINIPYETVDVNVHPSKIEVRFINEKPIFDAIYYGVKSSLMGLNERKQVEFCFKGNINDNTKNLKINKIDNLSDGNMGNNISLSDVEMHNENYYKVNLRSNKDKFANLNKSNFNDIEVTQKINPDKALNVDVIDISLEDSVRVEKKGETNPIKESLTSAGCQNTKLDCLYNKPNEEINIKIDNKFKAPQKVIGEIFNCYILMQYGENELIIVDKHAVHERIIYEKLKKEETVRDSQILLEPITIVLEKQEYAAIIDNLSLLSRSGYDIEDFGMGSVIVRSIPVYIDISQVKDSVIEIADYILANKKSLHTTYMDWIYHNIACRAAIKGGKPSSEAEIMALIDELRENPNIKYCPHGRPVSVVMRKKDVEKQFGRT